MLIDRCLTAYEWNEVHSIEVRAAPAAVLAAVRAVTARQMPVVGLLMSLRALPARILGHHRGHRRPRPPPVRRLLAVRPPGERPHPPPPAARGEAARGRGR